MGPGISHRLFSNILGTFADGLGLAIGMPMKAGAGIRRRRLLCDKRASAAKSCRDTEPPVTRPADEFPPPTARFPSFGAAVPFANYEGAAVMTN
jgi:hypothetical protein